MEEEKTVKKRTKLKSAIRKMIIVDLVLFWIFTVLFTLYNYRDSLGKQSSGNEFSDNVVELVQGVKIEEYVPVEDGADAIAIKMATYARKNSGTFNIKVIGTTTNEIYADQNVDISSLQDNAFIVVPLDQKLSESREYRVRVIMTSSCQPGNAAGVYYSTLGWFDESILTIGNETFEGDLSMRFLKANDDLYRFYLIIIVWVIISFSAIILLLLVVKPKYEILFTVMAIAFGLTFWLIITPMSVPDETIHYEYSFQLSNYMMGEKDHMVFNEEYQNYGAMAGHLNISAAYERFITKINRPLSLRDNDSRMTFDIDESYKICFIPQALGITVARLLNWNMLRTFYLGRLFNLMFYVLCVYIAIKKTPVHKVLFGIIATLPIFMQQAASFSYDCYINGLTFVIIAFLMKWMHEDEPVRKTDFIIAFIANLMIAPIKVVYGLFSFMYWFIPWQRFGSRKNKIIGILIITAPAIYELSVLLLPLVFRVVRKIFERAFAFAAVRKVIALDHIITDIRPSFVDGEVYTFSYVMAHPIEMLMLFLRTVRYSLKTWFYASFGRALSGNTLIIPTWIVHSLLAILVFSALRRERKSESIAFKIVSLLVCIFAGFMMVGGMLISWTEVEQVVIEDYGGPIIQGIQGRYFSPLLPYVFIMLNNQKLKLTAKADRYLIYTFILLVFEVIVYVLSYTFMN